MEERQLLLNRQLRNLFRVVPLYALSNVVTGFGVFMAMWPNLKRAPAIAWFLVFLASHLLWGVHALRGLRRNRQPAPLPQGMTDLHGSALLCAFAAIACSVGIYLAGPYAADDGTKILLASYVPGLIATGVLVGITAPLVSMVWLVIVTLGACLMVGRLDFMLQGMTVALLNFYALMLTAGLLFASRMFVARTGAEIAASRDRQALGLLLGDFEENATDWLWECDNEGLITRASARFVQLLGRHPTSVIGRPLVSLFVPQRIITVPSDNEVGVAALQERMAGSVAFSNLIIEAYTGGTQRSWKLSAKPLWSNGMRTGWRGVGSEVSDARAREAEGIMRERHLHHLATHDALTELPNRRAFLERIGRASEDLSERPGTCSAMAFIDLDNFKAVNDTLGHSVGDAILKNVAERLRHAVQPGDFLARLGGDEFAILMLGLPASEPSGEIKARALRVLEQLRVPENIEQFRIDVRGSIGITQMLGPLESPYELMRRADVAMYAAKDAGRDNFMLYEAGMSSHQEHRLSTVSDLSAALGRGEFELVYQCVVELASMKIVGCEALLRWHHPRYGLISPAEFIPAAEESGLVIPIGLWVLQQACRDARQWPAGMSVAVNVSAIQIGSPSIVASVVEAVRSSGLDPDVVELEITESAIARDDQGARKVLQELRTQGFRLSIDDFGTGYSSMVQLRELPFDRLKLDRSFVAGLSGERSTASRAIIDSLLHLSRSMDLSMIAEGVETEAEFRALREMGCQYAQGYLFAKPQPQQQLLPMLKAGYLRPPMP